MKLFANLENELEVLSIFGDITLEQAVMAVRLADGRELHGVEEEMEMSHPTLCRLNNGGKVRPSTKALLIALMHMGYEIEIRRKVAP